nr:hypothetical protein 3 [Moraxellaceae bacterium]
MNKLSQACNFCNNTSEHCCSESDKNYEAEQAKRERELREEDELFEVELSRLSWSWGAMVWSGE